MDFTSKGVRARDMQGHTATCLTELELEYKSAFLWHAAFFLKLLQNGHKCTIYVNTELRFIEYVNI